MSFDPNDEMRPLRWPLTNPRSLGASTNPDDTVTQIIWPTADDTERVTISLQLSLQEFTALSTAIDVGRDIAYNESSDYVWFLWVRSVIVSICNQVADCITNDTNVQNALQNFLTENGYGGGDGTPNTVSSDANDENLLPAGYTCDNDHLFGMSMEIVAMIHENTEELLQEVQSASGQYLDLFNALIDNIPAVEAVGLVTETIGWIIDSVGEDYDAAWSTPVQQEIACELFCRIKDDCNLSWDDIWETYLDISGLSEPEFDDLVGWLSAVINGTLGTGAQTVALVDMLGLAVMRYGGKFASWVAGIHSMETTIALAADATDSDWSILCDECPEGEAYEVDFTSGLGEWVIVYGSLETGGIQSEAVGGTQQIQIYLELETAWEFRDVSLVMDRESDGSFNDDTRIFINNESPPDATGLSYDVNVPSQSFGEFIVCAENISSVDRTGIYIILRDNNSENEILLKKAKLWDGAEELSSELTANSLPECYE